MDTSNATTQAKHLVNHRLEFVSEDEGEGAVLRNVVLLAAGEWHDSLSSYPTVYTPENLEAFKVRDATGWTVHSFSRGLNEEIGEFRNPRYDSAKHAIIVDLFLHGLTQVSRDVIGAIRARAKRGQASYVSVEMLTDDVMTDEGMVATNIVITGWVTTPNPACEKCVIPKQNSQNETNMTKTKSLSEGEDVDEVKPEVTLEELIERIAALENKCSEYDKRLAASDEETPKDEESEEEKAQSKPEDEVKELTAKLAELTKQLDAQNAQIKALEQNPASRVNVYQETETKAPVIEFKTRRL